LAFVSLYRFLLCHITGALSSLILFDVAAHLAEQIIYYSIEILLAITQAHNDMFISIVAAEYLFESKERSAGRGICDYDCP
jgi:hypothetical protein